jgi:hypothetical protein
MRDITPCRSVAVVCCLLIASITSAQQTNREKIELYRKIQKCTVKVRVEVPGGVQTGTGVGYARFGNYAVVITNAHVVTGSNGRISDFISIQPHGVEERNGAHPLYTALRGKLFLDVAFLVVADPDNQIGIAAKSTDPKWRTKRVYACGHPLGQSWLIDHGNVLAKKSMDAEIAANPHLIEHDALIEHGNSGGGLFDSHGDLVGINTWMVNGKRGVAVDASFFRSWFSLGGVAVRANQSDWISLPFAPNALNQKRALTMLAMGQWSVDGGYEQCSAAGFYKREDGPSYKVQPSLPFGCLLVRSGDDIRTFYKRWTEPGLMPTLEARSVQGPISLPHIAATSWDFVDRPLSVRVNDADASDNKEQVQLIFVLIGPPGGK